MKICPVGEKLHADGRTYTTKLIFAFRGFAKAPKNKTRSGRPDWQTAMIKGKIIWWLAQQLLAH